MTAKIIDGRRSPSSTGPSSQSGAAPEGRGPHAGPRGGDRGDDPASKVYVRNKALACEQIGMHPRSMPCPRTPHQAHLVGFVRRLNDDDNIHGILVQLPLPRSIDARAGDRAIAPGKDVDGFALPQRGRRWWSGEAGFYPCTPWGVMKMLEDEGSRLREACGGRGRSTIVGKPWRCCSSTRARP
jgi:methylenetetrahydrofolate dehydrogenase (NADP+)/methenyltetrahydrofolate cyclohydrolase